MTGDADAGPDGNSERDPDDRGPISIADAAPIAGRTVERARDWLADNLRLVALGLLVVALLSGAIAVTTHADPGTTTEQRPVATWSDAASFDHRATVRRDTAAFANGSTLTNRSVYFTEVTPTLRVDYRFRTHGHDEPVAVETDLLLRVRSTGEGPSGEDAVYWDLEERLGGDRTDSLAPGEAQTATATVNVTEIERRVAETEAQLGGSPGELDVRVVARSTVNGTVADEAVSYERASALTIDLRDGTYAVDAEGTGRKERRRTEAVSVPVDHGPVREYGSVALAVLSSGGLLALAAARSAGLLRARPERLRRFRDERDQYDEWITRGRLPDRCRDRPAVAVTSLEGLVDVAIDCDRRVIEDERSGAYVVVDDPVRYEYQPPEAERSSDGDDGQPPDPVDPLSDDALAVRSAERDDGAGADAAADAADADSAR